VTSLILSERILTTLPKAKELRRLADRMITWGKQGDLAARRQAARFLRTHGALEKLFNGLAKRFSERQGGYTRIVKFWQRRGDNAPMASIEYLGFEPKEKVLKKGEKKEGIKAKPQETPAKPEKKRWGLFRKKKEE
jgi:large subunit ribosomal protein L17